MKALEQLAKNHCEGVHIHGCGCRRAYVAGAKEMRKLAASLITKLCPTNPGLATLISAIGEADAEKEADGAHF